MELRKICGSYRKPRRASRGKNRDDRPMSFSTVSHLFSPSRRSPGFLLSLALVALAGCKDRRMTVYRVPRETPAAAAKPEAVAVAASSGPGIHWDAPAAWQTQKVDGMRLGSYLVTAANGTTADMSVVTFAGTGGEDFANVNRWRGQLQQSPLTEAELPAQVQTVTVPAGVISFVDVSGTATAAKSPARLLGAWFRTADRVWFFKLTGAAELVGAQREAFLGLLKSLKLTAENSIPAAPVAASTAPVGNRAMSAPQPTGDGPSLLWKAPADWQAKAASAMRKGSYAIGDAEVAITVFPGDVGGVLANVNRWRTQAGVLPVDAAGLAAITSTLDVNGLHFVVTDAASSGPAATRIVAALVPWQGRTWFFKLTGPNDAVGRAKPAFTAFLQTVSAPTNP